MPLNSVKRLRVRFLLVVCFHYPVILLRPVNVQGQLRHRDGA